MSKHKPSLKRLLPVLSGIGILAASASSVVSCTAPQYAAGIEGQRVVVSTDGGHINDHSFNEDAYLGVRNFTKDAYNLDGANDYVEAGGTDTTSIVSGYRLAILKKANAIVMPGFSHVNTLPSALPFLQKYNINVVLVDGIVKAPNVISIQFNSQLSGVMAGFDTSYLAAHDLKKYDVNHDGKIRIGTFAGASNKYGVDNYMWGLLLGMQIYNDVAEKNNWVKVETANNASGDISQIQTINNTDANFYTNSFALGDATKSGILYKLIDTNKADIMFPVAGPQIQDVINYTPQTGSKPYLIGVDVDQAAAYPSAAGRFITAGIKNIDTAVPEALYRATNDDGKGNTLKEDKNVIPSGKYGGWSESEHWLGKQPAPFVNWSIDYTDNNVPTDKGQGKYLLKQNYLKMYDAQNTQQPALTNGAMDDINIHFAKLGNNSADYMNGKDIFKFAQELVDHFGSNASSEVLDWSTATWDMGGDK